MSDTVRLQLLFLAGLLLMGGPAARAQLNPDLAGYLQTISDDSRMLVWVYFTDKGPVDLHKQLAMRPPVSGRSLARRANVLPPDRLTDGSDLPVYAGYVSALTATGAEIQHPSRWLNAASVLATPAQIRTAARLPSVRAIELTRRYRAAGRGERTPVPPEEIRPKTGSPDALDYGSSFGQLNITKVPALHAIGLSGAGVMVGVLDNGFRLLTHEAFDSMKIAATYDFVDRKTSVVPRNPGTGFGSHGVETLSTIGGYKPGAIIGPAYRATYILARTENDSSETPLEEDKWIAALEWMDSIGVQVTSTSLGYLDYDPPYASWTWRDMNGNATAITRAADMAAAKGIIVVNSAGNEGDNSEHNTLVAPADGDSVLAVGAATPTGSRAGFSSVGPTTSNPPRIKPDVMAQGSSVLAANPTNPKGYLLVQGTSFACPLAAGTAALLVEAYPRLPAMKIIEAMRATANNALSPNNKIGWGMLNSLAAYEELRTTDVGREKETVPEHFALDQNFPNPFNPGTTISYQLSMETQVTLRVFDMLGREVALLVNEKKEPGRHTVKFDGTGLASGVYLYRLAAGGWTETKRMVLVK